MKILLVDDSLRHRRAGIAQLQALGHEVTAMSSYIDAIREVSMQQFDAALIDLLMPAESQTLGTVGIEKYLGVEIGVGYPLAINLATLGVPRIACATDTNHHDHPLSAAVDWLSHKSLTINGAVVKFMHAPMQEDAKNWGEVLSRLMA